MFCINCGKQIPDGAKFCASCGANQNPDVATKTPVKEPVTPSVPEINLQETFSDCFGSAQTTVQPPRKKKSKLKKLSRKVKGFLITLLVFLVTFGVRHALENGIEGFFGFVGDSIKETQAKTYEELDALMAEQKVVVTSYNRGNWAEDGKTGPLLMAYMKNNSGKTITKVKIAIATWDKNGSPLYLTLDDGERNSTSNVTYLEFPNLYWLDGTVYNDMGLGLHSSSAIPERIQVIPVSWTYSDGETGYNSYKEDWLFKYENKLNERGDLGEIQFPQDLTMSEADLKTALQTQPLVTTNCEISQWAEGDLLCATIENKSTATIKCIYVAYVTWDAENKPVIITTKSGQSANSNVYKMLIDDLTVAPGESYGADNGFALHKDSAKVAKFNVIAYSYEDTEGNVWENPYYYAWLNLYEGK